MPPINSTITSEPARISPKSPPERLRTPARSGRRPVAAATASARSASKSANAPPTVPRPSRPILTVSLIPRGEVLVGLPPDDHPRIPRAEEDPRGAGLPFVVVGHRMAEGAGRGGNEDAPAARRRQADVANEDVTGLAVHAGDCRE